MQNSRKILRDVIGAIRSGRRFLIATHESPDGDGLASALALARGLRKMKKEVKVYDRDPVPGSLRFLPGCEEVVSCLSAGEQFDASFLVDCSDPARVGAEFQAHLGLGKLIVLDHHARGRRGGDLNLIDIHAASSGVVVHRLLRELGVRIDRAMATNIYCTLVTDTGNFRHDTTSAEVFGLAAELVVLGARPWEISRWLQNNYPHTRLRLLSRVLKTLELKDQGRMATIVLTRAMLRATGATADLAEDFVDFPRSIDTVELAVFIRETGPTIYKVSLRSKTFVDVGGLALKFGGGGHVRAAGFSMKGSLQEIRKMVERVSKKALRGACGK